MKVILNKETGRYELENGGWLSSPSRILRPLTIEKYQDIPKHFLEMAATFGKQAHSNIEMYEKLGADEFAEEEIRPLIFSGNHQNVFNQYLNWKAIHNVEVLETEKVVWNIEDRYFGYVDTIAMVDGKKTIIDLKTRSKLESDDDYLTEKLQLMLYRDAYFQMTGEEVDIAILMIKKTTKNKRVFIKIDKSIRQRLRKLLNSLKRVNTNTILYKEELEKRKQWVNQQKN